MRIDKRESDKQEIYYLYENYNNSEIIVGFIMETADRGLDIIYNSRRIFLIKSQLDFLATQWDLNDLMSEIKSCIDWYRSNTEFLGRTDAMVEYYIIDKFCPYCFNNISGHFCPNCNKAPT